MVEIEYKSNMDKISHSCQNPAINYAEKTNKEILQDEIDRLAEYDNRLPKIIRDYYFKGKTLKKISKTTPYKNPSYSYRYDHISPTAVGVLKNRAVYLLEKHLRNREDYTKYNRFISDLNLK